MEQEKTIQELQKIIEDQQNTFRQIGDFAEGLNAVLGPILDGVAENVIVDLTLKKIMQLADENI